MKTKKPDFIAKMNHLMNKKYAGERALNSVDPASFDCREYFQGIKDLEYANSGYNVINSTNNQETLINPRVSLMQKCLIKTPVKEIRRFFSKGFEGAFESSKEDYRKNFENQAAISIEKTVSLDWRKAPCELVIKSALESNIALAKVYASDGDRPENAQELKNIEPRIVKRCLRRTSEEPWKEPKEDASLTRGMLLELDGVKKKRSRRR